MTVNAPPLMPGNKYKFRGYNNWVKILWLSLPGEHDDGGLPGVAVRWQGGRHGFYHFESEQDFWNSYLFNNLIDW